MAEGRERRLWDHTAQLVCALAEPWRDREEHPQPFAPWEFHPYLLQERKKRRKDQPPRKVSVSVLRFLVDSPPESP